MIAYVIVVCVNCGHPEREHTEEWGCTRECFCHWAPTTGDHRAKELARAEGVAPWHMLQEDVREAYRKAACDERG